MPVTAKLSRKFYEQFGDDIAGELVDWFNAVDLTYQTQLREMNELNWERFKATLLAESASIRSELRGEFRAGFAELRTEIAGLREQLHGEIVGLREQLHGEIVAVREQLHGEMSGGSAKLREEMNGLRTEMGVLRAEMGSMRANLIKWMFVFWCGSVVTVGGLVVGMGVLVSR